MPSDIPATPVKDAPTIQEEYRRRLDDDLARNSAAQAEAHEVIRRWRDRLAELGQEATWLTGLKNTLAGQSALPNSAQDLQNVDAAPVASSGSDSAGEGIPGQAVPAPRGARTPRSGGEASRQKAASAGQGAAKRRRPQTTRASGAPTLSSLVLGLLQQHHQPRTAAEVTAELLVAHPEREAKNQVVRNTLEQGVSKGRVTRSRQGRTVYYTAAAEDGAAETAE
ncbi:hypothetical protein ACIP98_36295 [Streptomyces sp. NPDC088354]|uniref:hypothetical protein n=1 Tax=Streptomyces sp. NPDC088354 TaxID=3365856 RepID=UPI00381848E9